MNLLMMLQVHQVMDCSKFRKNPVEMRPKMGLIFYVHLKIMVKYGQICTLGGKGKLQMIDI